MQLFWLRSTNVSPTLRMLHMFEQFLLPSVSLKCRWFNTEADVRDVTALTEATHPSFCQHAVPQKMFSRLRHWRNQIIHTKRTFTSCWASTNDLHFFPKYPSSQTPKSIFKKTTVYMYVLFQNDDIWLWVGCEERWSVQWFSGSIKRQFDLF